MMPKPTVKKQDPPEKERSPEIKKSDQATQSPSHIYADQFIPNEPRRPVYEDLHAKAVQVKQEIYNDRMR